MAVKSLTITEDAYSRLAALKEHGESFSELVCRMTAKSSLLDLAGILTKKEATELEVNIRKIRSEVEKRISQTAGKLK